MGDVPSWVGAVGVVFLLAGAIYAAVHTQGSKIKDDVISGLEGLLKVEREERREAERRHLDTESRCNERLAALEARDEVRNLEFAGLIVDGVVKALHANPPPQGSPR